MLDLTSMDPLRECAKQMELGVGRPPYVLVGFKPKSNKLINSALPNVLFLSNANYFSFYKKTILHRNNILSFGNSHVSFNRHCFNFCSAKDCGPLAVPTNGSFIGSLTVFPNKILFGCDQGFLLRGSHVRHCQANGNWSGNHTFCEGSWYSIIVYVIASFKVEHYCLIEN